MSGLDKLCKDPPARVPAELRDRNNQGSEPVVYQYPENPTYGDEHIQQGQVETRRPNRVDQRKDLPSGNEKVCRRHASTGLQNRVGLM